MRELTAKHRSADSLWHAVQFYTVGRGGEGRSIGRKGNIDYQTYADLNGVYTRGSWPIYHAALEAEGGAPTFKVMPRCNKRSPAWSTKCLHRCRADISSAGTRVTWCKAAIRWVAVG